MKLCFLILLLITSLLPRKMDAQQWHTFSGHFDNMILYVYHDSLTGFDFVCGLFDSLYGVPANNVGYFDGTQWNALGSGLNNEVTKVIRFHGDLYAVGRFDSSGTTSLTNSIARWNGIKWEEIDSTKDLTGTFLSNPGDPAYIQDICVYNDRLYFCGQFGWNDFTVQEYYSGLAYFDGQTIKPALYGGYIWRNMFTNMVVFKGNIYLTYDSFGKDSCLASPSQNAFVFVKYDSVCRTNQMIGNWSPGMAGRAIFSTDSLLYLGTNVSNSTGNYFTAFDGVQFSALGNGFNWQVGQIFSYNGQLTVTGDFTADFNGLPMYRIAVWNGNSWQPFPSMCNLKSFLIVNNWKQYLISGSLSDSCSGNFVGKTTIYPSPFTSIQENEEKSFFPVYPNPAKRGETINLKMDVCETLSVEFSIYNFIGSIVFRGTTFCTNGTLLIKIPELNSGLYIGTVTKKNSSLSFRFLIE